MGTARNWPEPGTYPSTVFNGYMACLINEGAASDGDIFPWYFRKYGLGPLIGKRTWGGVVGIRGFRPLVDGGFITAPEFGNYDIDGRWNMENHGVDPDIEVDNLPEILYQGRDQQLDRGIAELMKKITESPKKLPLPKGPPEKR
jgi:tricorn protease